ncbi:Nucleoid occlusion protein [subsurface metagenome]
MSKITAPALPVRFSVDETSVKDLADSIKKIGLIEPIIVRECKKGFEVIAGHRRLMAAGMAGLKKVKCIIDNVSDDDAETIKMHENYHRLDISPVEQAVYFSYLVQKKNMKQAEIAEILGVSEGFVSQRLAVMSWHEEMISALDEGKISFSAARELSRITEEPALLLHLNQAVEHGVTPRVANIWWQDWLKSKNVDLKGEKDVNHLQDSVSVPSTFFDCSICKTSFEYNALYYMRICKDCHTVLLDNHPNFKK